MALSEVPPQKKVNRKRNLAVALFLGAAAIMGGRELVSDSTDKKAESSLNSSTPAHVKTTVRAKIVKEIGIIGDRQSLEKDSFVTQYPLLTKAFNQKGMLNGIADQTTRRSRFIMETYVEPYPVLAEEMDSLVNIPFFNNALQQIYAQIEVALMEELGTDPSFEKLTPARVRSINEALRKNPKIKRAIDDYYELNSNEVEGAFVDYLNDRGWEIESLSELGKKADSSL